jgi:hypothetical protein
VSGAIGIDPQWSRTSIGLIEGDTGVGRPIGDGRRGLVPNACGEFWGSRAAEDALRAARIEPGPDGDDGDLDVDLGRQLFGWRTDPLGEPFLRGLHDRLYAYLGHTEPTNRAGYHAHLVTGPAEDATEELLRRCAAVGLTSVTAVRPTDALVHRWLADPGAEFPYTGTVLAVACGETWTAATAYRVDRSPAGEWIDAVATGWRPVGASPAIARLARTVLDRCREGVPALSLLALLDGVLEFGPALADAPAGQDVVWDGPLTDRMYAPLRLGRAAVAAWPEVARTGEAVSELARTVLAETRPGRVLVLAGGIGAVWPVPTDRLAEFGPVWRSQEPAHDLALGAALSGRRQLGLELAAAVDRPAVAPTEPAAAPELLDLPPADRADPTDVPPWLRDG